MEELRVNLINAINASGLPIEAVVFVVRDVYRDVNETFRKMTEEAQKASSEENNNNNNKEDEE